MIPYRGFSTAATVFAAVFGQAAFAQAPGNESRPSVKNETQSTRDVATYASDQTVRDESRPTGTGFSLYAGFDGGLTQVLPDKTEEEAKKFGYHLGVKGIATLFTNEIVLDFGVGFLFNQVQGDRDIETLADGSKNEIIDSQITTQAAFVEFSPRLRLGDSFQIGPVGQAYLGGDSSFALPSEKDRNAVLAGLSVMWSGGKDVLWRVGAQALADVNLFERQVYTGMLSLQIGLPIIRQKTIVRDKRFLSVKENVRTQLVDKPVEKIIIKESVRFLFEEQIINFEFDKAVLLRKSDYFVRELARFLVANPDIYENLAIEGHTDSRGSRDYNIRLSENRAGAVREALQKYGVPSERIRSTGFGFTRPLDPNDSDIAHARNRRVEMAFGGVKEPNRLREAIDAIKNRMRTMP